MPTSSSSTPPVPIGIAERDTGFSKDTLRIWERRYGFPSPVRDPAGERAYPPDQIAKLRLIRRLVDEGRRPGQVVALSMPELQLLIEDAPAPPSVVAPARTADRIDLAPYVDLLHRHDAKGLRGRLGDACVRWGLERFIVELVAPLTTEIGDAWMRGRLAIYEEHLFSESLQVVLRAATARLPEPGPDARPRVLLTTFVGEPHGLGLLMAQGLLALDGVPCVSLGVETPVWDIAQAAAAFRSDVVALSFTGAMNPNAMVDGLKDLRGRLGPAVELWAGGGAPALHRRAVAGVVPLATLPQLHARVSRWRDAVRA